METGTVKLTCPTVKDCLLIIILRAVDPPEAESLAHRLRDFNKVLKRLHRNKLEEELNEMVRVVARHKKYSAMAVRYFGWDGNGRATLQEVGDQFGLTRQRVQQIIDPITTRLQQTRPFMPVLDRALSAVTSSVPTLADIVEQKLQSSGISRFKFRLDGLLTAGEILDRADLPPIFSPGIMRLSPGLSPQTQLL